MFDFFKKLRKKRIPLDEEIEKKISSSHEVLSSNYDYYGKERFGARITKFTREGGEWSFVEDLDEIDNIWSTAPRQEGTCSSKELKEFLLHEVLLQWQGYATIIKFDDHDYRPKRR